MIKIILLLVACCLLFGAFKVGKGIAIFLLASALVIIGLVVALFIFGFVSNAPDDSASDPGNGGYLQSSFEDLSEDIAGGVDAAKSKYLDQKIVLSGRFDKMNTEEEVNLEGVSEDSIILSDLDYEDADTFWVIGQMKTDEQRETFKQFSEGEIVVLRGTVIDVTESTVSIDIDDME